MGMTDDERLLEIATRLMAAHIGNAEWKRCEPYSDTARRSLTAAEELMNQWRAHTGAQGREQDVSDALLADACAVALHPIRENEEASDYCRGVYEHLKLIQRARARAAGKGEGT